MTDASCRGRFVWYELMTSDADAAVAFYTKAIGWGTQAWDGGPVPYTMWTTGQGPMGGVMKLPAEAAAMGAPPHWMGYVGTPDVDATVERATALGARVLVPPTDVASVGRFAVLADPQGAAFSVYTPASESPGHETRPGEISWHELATTDSEAAFAFYTDLFGWTKMAAHDMGPLGIYQVFGVNGTTLGGMFTKGPDMPFPPNWLYYTQVEGLDEVAARVTANGGRVINGPMEVPGGDRIAQCLDPQGAAFALHERKHA